MITLGNAQTLGGRAGTTGVILYTLNGDSVSGSTDTFTTLAQGTLTTSIVTLYTTASGANTIIKNVHLVNTSASPVTGVAFYINGNAITSGLTIPANGMATYSDGAWVIYNSTGLVVTTGAPDLSLYFNKTTDDSDDITQGTTNLFLTAAERTKLTNTSGNNTGDQTITLTGDVAGSGTGSFATTIQPNTVTNTKLAQAASQTIKGRATAGTGNVEDLTATQVRTITETETSTQLNARDTANRARANHTGTQTASTISDFDTQVRTSRLDQMAAPTTSVSLNNQKITNLATPTAGTDAVNKSYADGLVVGLLDDRGSYDASVNTFPSTGGSGTAGAILKGDLWYISVAGTLGGVAVNVGDSVRALVDTPGQTATNWSVLEANIGFVPENVANKSTTTTLGTSNTLYPTQNAVKTYVDTQDATKVTANAAITAGTATKITYDTKGLVTAGANATTADINDSTDRRYVTDAQRTVITNTSGTNTGDVTVTDTASVDLTLTGQNIQAAVIPNTTTQRVVVSKAGTTTGTRKQVNFIEGTNVTITTADNSATDSVDVTINAAGGGGGGGGDVTGPASSTDNAITRFDGTTGKVVQNSGASIDDAGNISATNLSGTNTGDQTSIVGITGTTAQFNAALTDNDFATIAGTETLSNKTIQGNLKGTDGTFTYEIVPTGLTANRTVSFGNIAGSLLTNSTSATVTNKTLSTGTSVTASIAFSAGVKQTFAPSATTSGLNVGSVAGDPTTLANGDIWYDSTGNALRTRINGATASLGSGTVTSVSATGTQGVTTSVATGTTTPAITIGLGAITPTSVAATGTVTGSNLSGTNTGDQTNVTGSSGTTNALNTTTTAVNVSGATAPTTGQVLTATSATTATWQTPAAGGGGSGTVTNVSVTSTNGFAGTVANPTTTPAITLSTTVTGILKGNGTAISAATAGTDYVVPSGSITGSSGTVDTINGRIAAGTNVTLTGTGTAASPYVINAAGGGGGFTPTIARLTATQASTAVALANVTQLVGAMVANGTYEVNCFVTFQSAATTTGLNLGFTSPAGSSNMLEIVVPIASTAVASALRTTFPNAALTVSGNVLGTGVTAINSNHTARISGIIVNGATAGNFQVQFATEIANSAVTLQIGSTLVLTRIA